MISNNIYNSFLNSFRAFANYLKLIGTVFWVTLVNPPKFSVVREQLYEIGVMSLFVVVITGFSTGSVLAAQAYFNFVDKGFASATGLAVTKAMMVEMGPVLTAFMLTGRVGSAMCAELGSMRVSEQIDALQSMSVNPVRYLVAPRFIAGIFMLPVLTIFSTITGIIGGYIVSVYYFGMDPTTFLEPLPTHIRVFDFVSGLIKAFIFGIIIVTISCYKGMTTVGGAAGVGKATTQSVVICYCCILIGNFFLTVALNNSNAYIEQFMQRWF